jgi:hypothetical protein
MSLIIYLDESGDLGWNFSAPHRQGGSSRYLTIASLCVSPEKKHLPKRVVRGLYDKFGWSPATEKKWAQMNANERTEFANAAKKMCDKHGEIQPHAIVVKKENVENHIRADANKLYNYMIGLSLTEVMALHDRVTLVPDPRSIKVESGNSLHDYLQIQLWFVRKAKTVLRTMPEDSKHCLGLQFVDMFAGLVQSRFETSHTDDFAIILPKTKVKCLFFK